ncbi:hypothetical protein [Vibrio harveyi]|uniref:hypothetical protein n=1 Tax=Vibrio harveyi TaxID=669 RepID=UPI003CF7CBD6
MPEKCKHCGSKNLIEDKVDSIVNDYMDPVSNEITQMVDAIYVDFKCETCGRITTEEF